MKKVLLIVASILFAGGLYVNFAMEPSTGDTDLIDETGTEEEIAGEDPEEAGQDEDAEEAPSNETVESEPEDEVAFNQESLNEVYEEAVQNNEALIIDVLLPGYYSEDFLDNIENEFDTGTIQFNRLDIDSNTLDLNELTVNENSDAVIIDALQIRDDNDNVLTQRDAEALGVAYTNIYDSDKTVFLLGNPNVDQNDDLAEVLAEEETYFTENDYYYIDNQDVEADDEDVMTPAVENEIIANIHDYLISES